MSCTKLIPKSRLTTSTPTPAVAPVVAIAAAPPQPIAEPPVREKKRQRSPEVAARQPSSAKKVKGSKKTARSNGNGSDIGSNGSLERARSLFEQGMEALSTAMEESGSGGGGGGGGGGQAGRLEDHPGFRAYREKVRERESELMQEGGARQQMLRQKVETLTESENNFQRELDSARGRENDVIVELRAALARGEEQDKRNTSLQNAITALQGRFTSYVSKYNQNNCSTSTNRDID
jgi:hypothetical protein